MCTDVDVRMRMRMYACDRVPAYAAFRMRNFLWSYDDDDDDDEKVFI